MNLNDNTVTCPTAWFNSPAEFLLGSDALDKPSPPPLLSFPISINFTNNYPGWAGTKTAEHAAVMEVREAPSAGRERHTTLSNEEKKKEWRMAAMTARYSVLTQVARFLSVVCRVRHLVDILLEDGGVVQPGVYAMRSEALLTVSSLPNTVIDWRRGIAFNERDGDNVRVTPPEFAQMRNAVCIDAAAHASVRRKNSKRVALELWRRMSLRYFKF